MYKIFNIINRYHYIYIYKGRVGIQGYPFPFEKNELTRDRTFFFINVFLLFKIKNTHIEKKSIFKNVS